MSKEEHIPDYATLAVFTVCAEAELSGLASESPDSFPGLVFAGEFQEYITANRRPHFPQSMNNALFCVALVDFDRDPDGAVETVEVLDRLASPRVTCIGVSSQLDTDLLLRAMRAGCSEFLQKPVLQTHLHEALERTQTRLLSTMESSSKRGRVLSFFGAKGGVGTSTLAVHLATYVVKRHGRKTLLIDHHHQLGHICLYLGLKENHYHFDELVRNVDRLDADLLDGFLVRHVSGLAVIASPDTCATRYRTTLSEMERVLEFLRHEYDLILLDSSLQYEEAASLIQLSDEVYIVSTPEVAALRDLSRHVEGLSLSDTATSRLRIVINRASTHDAISAEQIEKAVRFPLSITIQNNYAELLQAINSGEPISPQRRSEFTMQLGKWANQVAEQSGDSSPKTAPAPKSKFRLWR